MKSIKLNKNFIFKNIDYIFLLITVATFPIKRINTIAILLTMVISFFKAASNKLKGTKFPTFFWILLAVFSLNIFGLLYSKNISRGFTIIGRQSIYILFPLLYIFYYPKNIKLVFKVFIGSIFVFVLVSEIDILYRFFYKSDVFPLNVQLFFSYRYTGVQLTKLIGIHNAYLGMYIVFSNVLIINFIQKENNNNTIIFLLFILFFQSVFILQMVSKTAILLNSILIPILLLTALIKKRKLKTTLASLIVLIGLIWFVTAKFNLPAQRIKDRFIELKTNSNEGTRINRFNIWNATRPIIQKNFFLGVGTGDANSELQNQINKTNYKFKSNTHNQFLDYFIRFGVIGFGLFIFSIAFSFFIALKTNNYIYFWFTFIVIISCLTENILSRQWGITFYSYFNYLLYNYSIKIK